MRIMWNSKRVLIAFALALGISLGFQGVPRLYAAADPAAQSSPSPTAVGRWVGTVKAVDSNTIVFVTDAGAEIKIAVQSSTRLLRVAPGQRDLSGAKPTTLSEVQAGDRVAIRGTGTGDSGGFVASSVLVMAQSDVAARQAQERADWQKRGVGGLVTATNPGNGEVTISAITAGGPSKVVVRAGAATVVRRYAADSVKFEEAKPGTLDQIRVGDQLRARGNRSQDGTEFVAEEIVSGTFLSIAGTVNSLDPATHVLNVTDLKTKKPVTIRISDDSRLTRLPPPIAQRLAIRLKQGAGGSSGGESAAPSPPVPPANVARAGSGERAPLRDGDSLRPGGATDLQEMLNRLPSLSPDDLHKGDAVMLVATEGTSGNPATLITLLAGVEPILTASPRESGAMILSPWNVGGSSMGEESAQ